MGELRKALGFWLVFFYGLGTILGAGIYVLVGKVALLAGVWTPLSFLLSAFLALFTALSYGELCSAFPVAAGEAAYVGLAFGKKWLSGLIGWMVIFTGVVSAATLSRGFVGYFQYFAPFPDWVILLIVILGLGVLAGWGITQSIKTAMVITLLEVGGLILVICFAGWEIGSTSLPFPRLEGTFSSKGLFLGAFLAFYAFIGFEDMVNIAEEVKHPRTVVPKALLWALAMASFFYLLVATSLIWLLPQKALGESDAPFLLVFQKLGLTPALIALISLVAILNGILVQIIMASRILYGMAKQRSLFQVFSRVNLKTATPLLATGCVVGILLLLALIFPLVFLAELTSGVILGVFILVNGALVWLKIRGKTDGGAFHVPLFVPILGLILNGGFLLSRVWFG